MRSTRSNTSAPSWSRTVSPRMRPSSRMSLRSLVSSSSAEASSARLDLSSVSEGMIWGDIVKMLQKLPGASLSCNFLGAAQDQEKGEQVRRASTSLSSSAGNRPAKATPSSTIYDLICRRSAGARFSILARTASSWLAPPISFICSTDLASNAGPGSTERLFSRRLAARMASGLLPAISRAISKAAARGSSQIRVASP